jgi:hypothetical protein
VGKKVGRPKVSLKVENAIREHLSAGNGILKVAAMVSGNRDQQRARFLSGDRKRWHRISRSQWPVTLLTQRLAKSIPEPE